MTIELDLPPDLECKLTSNASQAGLSLREYVLRLLDREANDRPAAKTGAEVVAYWQKEGLIGTRTAITDSAERARNILLQVERKKWPK